MRTQPDGYGLSERYDVRYREEGFVMVLAFEMLTKFP